MSSQNQAAWLHAKGEPLKVGEAQITKPGKGELLIKNQAWALNPVDWKIQDSGHFVQHWPTILGCDLAGEIVEVGEGVSHFAKGQRVLAHSFGLATGKDSNGSFQLYSIVLAAVTAPIPDDMSFADASVLPLSLSTASAGLFDKNALALPFPTQNAKSTGKTLLIWGGSSSVGSSAIQLAVAAGVEVVTTASKKNFEYCKKLGAKAVFDHTSPGIVGDLVTELQKGEVAGAYDAIGLPDTTMQVGQVLVQLGGGYIASVLPPPEDLPATVNSKQVYAPNVALGSPEIAKAIYGEFLPGALASGRFVPAPQATVVGNGLDSLQGAMIKLKAGVSASKLVVTV